MYEKCKMTVTCHIFTEMMEMVVKNLVSVTNTYIGKIFQ